MMATLLAACTASLGWALLHSTWDQELEKMEEQEQEQEQKQEQEQEQEQEQGLLEWTLKGSSE